MVRLPLKLNPTQRTLCPLKSNPKFSDIRWSFQRTTVQPAATGFAVEPTYKLLELRKQHKLQPTYESFE